MRRCFVNIFQAKKNHWAGEFVQKAGELDDLSHTCVKSGFLIGLEQVSLSSSSPAFWPNSPAFGRTHPRNCSRCNNNNKYGGQDLADKPRL
jgi:hypothetical protein